MELGAQGSSETGSLGVGQRDNVNETESAMRDAIWQILRSQSEEISSREPLLENLIYDSILQHSSFGAALIHRLAHKLGGKILTTAFFLEVFRQCLHMDPDGVVERLALEDLIAVEERDPACISIAQVFLNFKCYQSIQFK